MASRPSLPRGGRPCSHDQRVTRQTNRTDSTSSPPGTHGDSTTAANAVPDDYRWMLDGPSHPRIIARIIQFADQRTLIRLRGVSKAVLDLANQRIFGHVRLEYEGDKAVLHWPKTTTIPVPYRPKTTCTQLPFQPIPPRSIGRGPWPPAGNPLQYTHTVDLHHKAGPYVASTPEFPSLKRSRATHFHVAPAPEYVTYCDFRSGLCRARTSIFAT